jgi:hypothetical protein
MTRHGLSQTQISANQWQQWTWQNICKIWLTVGKASSVIHILNSTAQPNKQLCHFDTTYTKETQKVWHKNYRFCYTKRQRPTYSMTVYLGRRGMCNTLNDSCWYNCNWTYCKDWKSVGHKIYIDNSSPELSDDLCTKTMNSYRTVRPKRKVMTKIIGEKMKLKQGSRLRWGVNFMLLYNWRKVTWYLWCGQTIEM